MTHKDWLCPVCKRMMIVPCFESGYLVCSHGCGKLHKCWGAKDLPEAIQINNKNFHIRGIPYGVYQYVPHGHKTALLKAPAEGHVVASVAFRGHRAVRLFRRKRTLKERLTEHHFQKLGEAAGR